MKENCKPAKNFRALSNDPVLQIIFSGQTKDLTIRNGHSSLVIPRETVEAIKKLNSEDKLVVLEKMSKVLGDAHEVILGPKK